MMSIARNIINERKNYPEVLLFFYYNHNVITIDSIIFMYFLINIYSHVSYTLIVVNVNKSNKDNIIII